jgi:hypothetical protein
MPAQHFDSDVASELGVASAVHFSHPALADPFVHEIRAEPTTGKVMSDLACHCPGDQRRRESVEHLRRRGLVEQRLHFMPQPLIVPAGLREKRLTLALRA